jgi:predicted DNA-binding transcriptional regulator AlpA
MANNHVLTVAEVAALTGFSRDTIIRVFQNEPGVLVIARPSWKL